MGNPSLSFQRATISLICPLLPFLLLLAATSEGPETDPHSVHHLLLTLVCIQPGGALCTVESHNELDPTEAWRKPCTRWYSLCSPQQKT